MLDTIAVENNHSLMGAELKGLKVDVEYAFDGLVIVLVRGQTQKRTRGFFDEGFQIASEKIIGEGFILLDIAHFDHNTESFSQSNAELGIIARHLQPGDRRRAKHKAGGHIRLQLFFGGKLEGYLNSTGRGQLRFGIWVLERIPHRTRIAWNKLGNRNESKSEFSSLRRKLQKLRLIVY